MRRAGKLVALIAALLTIGSAAVAQVPEQRGMFGHIDGRWMWLGGERIETAQITEQRTTSGPGGQALIGFKLTPHWDIALAGDVQGLLTQITQLRGGTLSTDANHQHFDLEVGYSEGWWRVNGGLRGLRFQQNAALNVPGVNTSAQRLLLGIGPKIGFGARGALSDSWAVIGGADLALLYGMFEDTGSGLPISSATYSRIVPQVGAELGLSWRSADTPSLAFTAGGRIATSFNTTIVADGTQTGTLFEYGPFVRIAYNFAGPARVAIAPVATAASETDEAAAPTRKLTAFFDFDRANLSPVAAGTIRQAAADARHGRPTSILVTGPGEANAAARPSADKALALRRANAVRDELVRQGVDTSQIAVRGRSERSVQDCLVQISF